MTSKRKREVGLSPKKGVKGEQRKLTTDDFEMTFVDLSNDDENDAVAGSSAKRAKSQGTDSNGKDEKESKKQTKYTAPSPSLEKKSRSRGREGGSRKGKKKGGSSDDAGGSKKGKGKGKKDNPEAQTKRAIKLRETMPVSLTGAPAGAMIEGIGSQQKGTLFKLDDEKVWKDHMAIGLDPELVKLATQYQKTWYYTKLRECKWVFTTDGDSQRPLRNDEETEAWINTYLDERKGDKIASDMAFERAIYFKLLSTGAKSKLNDVTEYKPAVISKLMQKFHRGTEVHNLLIPESKKDKDNYHHMFLYKEMWRVANSYRIVPSSETFHGLVIDCFTGAIKTTHKPSLAEVMYAVLHRSFVKEPKSESEMQDEADAEAESTGTPKKKKKASTKTKAKSKGKGKDKGKDDVDGKEEKKEQEEKGEPAEPKRHESLKERLVEVAFVMPKPDILPWQRDGEQGIMQIAKKHITQQNKLATYSEYEWLMIECYFDWLFERFERSHWQSLLQKTIRYGATNTELNYFLDDPMSGSVKRVVLGTSAAKDHMKDEYEALLKVWDPERKHLVDNKERKSDDAVVAEMGIKLLSSKTVDDSDYETRKKANAALAQQGRRHGLARALQKILCDKRIIECIPTPHALALIVCSTTANVGSQDQSTMPPSFISGVQAITKRLFMSLLEDGDPNQLGQDKRDAWTLSLIASCFAAKYIPVWKPSQHHIQMWINIAWAAWKSSRALDYDSARGQAMPLLRFQPDLIASGVRVADLHLSHSEETFRANPGSSWTLMSILLDAIQGMAGDLGMVRYLANAMREDGELPYAEATRNERPYSMPIHHCIDQHCAGAMVYYFDAPMVMESTKNLKKKSKPFAGLLNQVFHNVTGFNPRRAELDTEFETDEFVVATRQAQRRYMHAFMTRHNDPRVTKRAKSRLPPVTKLKRTSSAVLSPAQLRQLSIEASENSMDTTNDYDDDVGFDREIVAGGEEDAKAGDSSGDANADSGGSGAVMLGGAAGHGEAGDGHHEPPPPPPYVLNYDVHPHTLAGLVGGIEITIQSENTVTREITRGRGATKQTTTTTEHYDIPCMVTMVPETPELFVVVRNPKKRINIQDVKSKEDLNKKELEAEELKRARDEATRMLEQQGRRLNAIPPPIPEWTYATVTRVTESRPPNEKEIKQRQAENQRRRQEMDTGDDKSGGSGSGSGGSGGIELIDENAPVDEVKFMISNNGAQVEWEEFRKVQIQIPQFHYDAKSARRSKSPASQLGKLSLDSGSASETESDEEAAADDDDAVTRAKASVELDELVVFQNSGLLGQNVRQEEMLNELLARTDVHTVRMTVVALQGFRRKVEFQSIARDGGGTSNTVVTPDDVAVFQFLLKLSAIFPSALRLKQYDPLHFQVRVGPLLWTLRKRIAEALAELTAAQSSESKDDGNDDDDDAKEVDEEAAKKIDTLKRWGGKQRLKDTNVYADPDAPGGMKTREPYPFQMEAVMDMARRRQMGEKGHFLFIPPGCGKTYINNLYIHRLIYSGVMPKYDVYTGPISAMRSVIEEHLDMGFSLNIVLPVAKNTYNNHELRIVAEDVIYMRTYSNLMAKYDKYLTDTERKEIDKRQKEYERKLLERMKDLEKLENVEDDAEDAAEGGGGEQAKAKQTKAERKKLQQQLKKKLALDYKKAKTEREARFPMPKRATPDEVSKIMQSWEKRLTVTYRNASKASGRGKAKKSKKKKRDDDDDDDDNDSDNDVEMEAEEEEEPEATTGSDQNLLKPYVRNIIDIEQHLRLMERELLECAHDMVFTIDECHKCQNPTQRTATALAVAKSAFDWIAMSGTPVVDKNEEKIIQWLEMLVPFEVNSKNYLVALNGMINKQYDTGLRPEDIDVAVPWDDPVFAPLPRTDPRAAKRPDFQALYREYQDHVLGRSAAQSGIGGRPNFRAAYEIEKTFVMHYMLHLAEMVCQDRKESGAMLVTDTSDDQRQAASIANSGGMQFGETNRVTPMTSTIKLSPANVFQGRVIAPNLLIVRRNQNAGYDAHWFRWQVKAPYGSNQADRSQMEGRINRIGSRKERFKGAQPIRIEHRVNGPKLVKKKMDQIFYVNVFMETGLMYRLHTDHQKVKNLEAIFAEYGDKSAPELLDKKTDVIKTVKVVRQQQKLVNTEQSVSLDVFYGIVYKGKSAITLHELRKNVQSAPAAKIGGKLKKPRRDALPAAAAPGAGAAAAAVVAAKGGESKRGQNKGAGTASSAGAASTPKPANSRSNSNGSSSSSKGDKKKNASARDSAASSKPPAPPQKESKKQREKREREERTRRAKEEADRATAEENRKRDEMLGSFEGELSLPPSLPPLITSPSSGRGGTKQSKPAKQQPVEDEREDQDAEMESEAPSNGEGEGDRDDSSLAVEDIANDNDENEQTFQPEMEREFEFASVENEAENEAEPAEHEPEQEQQQEQGEGDAEGESDAKEDAKETGLSAEQAEGADADESEMAELAPPSDDEEDKNAKLSMPNSPKHRQETETETEREMDTQEEDVEAESAETESQQAPEAQKKGDEDESDVDDEGNIKPSHRSTQALTTPKKQKSASQSKPKIKETKTSPKAKTSQPKAQRTPPESVDRDTVLPWVLGPAGAVMFKNYADMFAEPEQQSNTVAGRFEMLRRAFNVAQKRVSSYRKSKDPNVDVLYWSYHRPDDPNEPPVPVTLADVRCLLLSKETKQNQTTWLSDEELRGDQGKAETAMSDDEEPDSGKDEKKKKSSKKPKHTDPFTPRVWELVSDWLWIGGRLTPNAKALGMETVDLKSPEVKERRDAVRDHTVIHVALTTEKKDVTPVKTYRNLWYDSLMRYVNKQRASSAKLPPKSFSLPPNECRLFIRVDGRASMPVLGVIKRITVSLNQDEEEEDEREDPEKEELLKLQWYAPFGKNNDKKAPVAQIDKWLTSDAFASNNDDEKDESSVGVITNGTVMVASSDQCMQTLWTMQCLLDGTVDYEYASSGPAQLNPKASVAMRKLLAVGVFDFLANLLTA